MWKKIYGFALVFTAIYSASAQTGHLLSFSDNQDFDQVSFSFTATDGRYFILPGTTTEILKISMGNDLIGTPTCDEKIIGRTRQINVRLNEDKSTYLGSSISRRMFSGQEDTQAYRLFLAGEKPMALDLNYAVGDTRIDLSGLPVNNLKMYSGSANIFVDYESGEKNLVVMDTFKIKVDMGKLNAKNLHLSRSKTVIADVGFGSVYMDFENAFDIASDVKASVGAGKLEVILPEGNIPVRININSSPLCRVKMPSDFKKSMTTLYSNTDTEFATNGPHYINFDIDVAVGNIVFKYADK